MFFVETNYLTLQNANFCATKVNSKRESNKRIFPRHQIKNIDLLLKRRLIPWKNETAKQVRAKKDIGPKYNFLRHAHGNPKKEEIHDVETDTIDLYPSIYKAALTLDQNPEVIGMYNGKVLMKRYALKVLTES